MTQEEYDAYRARSVHDHAREIATARGRLYDSLGYAVTAQQMRREL